MPGRVNHPLSVTNPRPPNVCHKIHIGLPYYTQQRDAQVTFSGKLYHLQKRRVHDIFCRIY